MKDRRVLPGLVGMVLCFSVAGCATTIGSQVKDKGEAQASDVGESESGYDLPVWARLSTSDDGSYEFSAFRPVAPTELNVEQEWVNLSDDSVRSDARVADALGKIPNIDVRLDNLAAVYESAVESIGRLRSVYQNAPLPRVRFDIDESAASEKGQSFVEANEIQLEESMPRVRIAFNEFPEPLEGMMATENAGFSSFNQLEQSLISQINRSLLFSTQQSQTVNVRCLTPPGNKLDYIAECPREIPVGADSFTIKVKLNGWADK
ncbi:hypothetical protein [Marinobacter salarius]|uniref:Lipoprotein n=1 Tax=Marinobacter salarius TaxID=1420917 RepID=A0A1W6KG16_9GAMM|nr:hypothetical protein [Marinobacter salarius]ARM86353.1 hypothetical protein MARSALSMR5_04336 [Marinobacter salarius]